MPHLLLIDASGFAHRAYHVGAQRFRSDGLPTWAIEGFLAMMWRLLGHASHDQPTHAAACFDYPGPTFRHQLFPAYKNNRPARDAELTAQIPYMHLAAEAMGITPIDGQGYEADDLIATLTALATDEGWSVTIVSSDKDYCQLVRDGEDAVRVYDPVQHVMIDEEFVRSAKFGVEPSQVTDLQALAGDAVDNIPGIEGIGPKSGAAYVRLFGTVEEIVAATRTAPNFFTPGHRARLKEPGTLEKLQLYRELARLRTDVPVEDFILDKLPMRPIVRDVVNSLLKTLEASGRFEAIFAGTPQTARQVETLGPEINELDWWAEECLCPGQPVPDLPQCGYYERKLHENGVFVPACIYREPEVDPVTGEPTGMDLLKCQVGEQAADPVQEWSRLFRNPITKPKYDFEMADARWAREYAKDDPKANPRKGIDLRSIPAVHPPQLDRQKRKNA